MRTTFSLASAAALLTLVLVPAAVNAADSEIELTVYGFKGTYKGNQVVKITGGTSDVKLAHLDGKTRAFDLTLAQFDIDDTNDDGYRDWRDIVPGDKLDIKADLKKKKPGKPPYLAYAVRDLTHPRPPRIS
ncbi:MAG: hypothetical protein QOG62_601 [Thermoleophilaceae bacterium]|jgi:hypothetical protein|nr:hypothetical protein [Thermoleophilaceae bacterium]